MSSKGDKIISELKKGLKLSKCRKCGCMKNALENMRDSLKAQKTDGSSDLVREIEESIHLMEPIEYSCLGCKHCFGAEIVNSFEQTFPEFSGIKEVSCSFDINDTTWPPEPGEYFTIPDGQNCSVAVSTLASIELAQALADHRPDGLCIVGKTETENIGIDKVIKNVIANHSIRILLLVGIDADGHKSGGTFLALAKNGVDENRKVIGSPGKRPILQNVTDEQIAAFRGQVSIVDMIGCQDVVAITAKIRELLNGNFCSGHCERCVSSEEFVKTATVLKTETVCSAATAKMDKAGYFVITPQSSKQQITVEHYSYNNKLEHVIEGKDARTLYAAVIDNGWITELSHAAYLGKELAKAELSMKYGFKYSQDGA